MWRQRANKPHRDRPQRISETREPGLPLDGWPYGRARVTLTGDDQEECVKVSVHGVDHYLHSTTARALQEQLAEKLTEWNETATAAGFPSV